MSYSYSRVGEQKRLEQVPRRGNRISILGLWQPNEQFEYALAQGGFDGESYLKFMDWVAEKAALTLEQMGRLTVVVQDNPSTRANSCSNSGSGGSSKAYSYSSCRPTVLK